MSAVIQQKLRKIQAIGEEIHKIDGATQRIEMSMDKLTFNVDGFPITLLISPDVYTELRNTILESMKSRRQQLVAEAEQLMK